MNISGFELQHSAKSTFCRNAYCSAVIPMCFAGISPTCSRNRSFTGWCHFSFGEHVCNECMKFLMLSNSKSKISATHSIWRYRMMSSQRLWMQMSSPVGRRQLLTVEEFVAGNLLPWWMQCTKCGGWRQVVAHATVGSLESPYHPSRFTCELVSQGSSAPCSWPLDDRSVIVRSRPQDFLASMQIHAWLQGSPTLSLLSPFGIDLCGLSPDSLTGVTEGRKPTNDQNTLDSVHTIVDDQGPFSLLDIRAWERAVFPEMTRYPTFYLAARNLVLHLWASNPKNFLTTKFVVRHCFVRGLLRIVLCEHWVPHLIEEFTYRGIINLGLCIPDPPLSDRALNITGLQYLSQSATTKSPEDTELRVHVLGNLSLAAAVTTRQIRNGLLTRVQQIDCVPQSHVSRRFSVRFQMTSVARTIPSTSMPGALGELCITLNKSTPLNGNTVSSSVNDNSKIQANDSPCDSAPSSLPGEWCQVTLDTNENPSELFPKRLVLPMNMWSDRIYIHPNHPLHFMASQTDLSLRPLSRCPLFYSAVSGEEPVSRLRLVPDEVALRMQFHVEAVLDMVAQNGEHQHVNGDVSSMADDHKGCSVQDCWDRQDTEVRTRVIDLTKSDLERQLMEFYLAEVEFDLTEPLVTNNPYHFLGRNGFCGLHSWPCPTARLDLLPSHRYAEFTMDDGSETVPCNTAVSESRDNGLLGQPRILTPKSPSEGAISSLCALLLPTECCEPCEAVRVTVNRDLCGAMETSFVADEVNRSTCLISTPRADQVVSNVNPIEAGPDPSESTESIISVVNSKGESDLPNWVILTCPTGQLRLNFYDTSTEELSRNQPAIPGALILDLPVSLKSYLVRDECEPCATDSLKLYHDLFGEPVEPTTDTLARLLTVVLIYPTPWWRPSLCAFTTGRESTETLKPGGSSPTPLDWFAILPEKREDRGFCHTFRDVFPHLDRPGVLQTQLFGAAADHWWSKGDVLLTASVHRFLQSRWVSDLMFSPDSEAGVDGCANIPGPIHAHVTRMQHSVRRNGEMENQTLPNNISPIMTMMDYHGQVVRLHPNAWEELARRAHVLIPDLFPSSTVGLNEPSGFRGLTEVLQLTRSPGMDVLTSSVLDGLHSAELALRCIPGLGSGSILNYPSFHSKFASSVVDSSTLLSDCSQTDESQSTVGGPVSSGVGVLSARARRLLRRTHRESESSSLFEAV
ncbi:hypothetical protein FGIG_01130 [Fasciola gigantica]|uniref:Lysine-specific histone demethylase 1B n=1 Tax=Fasciola gigantica TaxID=46835 RepID=A0A504YAK8_FASGI|nr:hypothetical protein FGIG_01130 [Fasciola gigantica]